MVWKLAAEMVEPNASAFIVPFFPQVSISSTPAAMAKTSLTKKRHW